MEPRPPSGFALPSAEMGEEAALPYEPPASGPFGAAAFSAAAPMLGGLPVPLLDARNELEQLLVERSSSDAPWPVAPLDALQDNAQRDDVHRDNVQAVGIGLGEPGQRVPGEPVLTVFVAEPVGAKMLREALADGAGMRSVRDVPLSVRHNGFFDRQPHRFRERSAPYGLSTGHVEVTVGTIGCLAIGNAPPRNGRLLLLSNNHVLAAANAAKFGDPIIQPGRSDGGMHPADEIALLERYVPLLFGGGVNHVDCATAWCHPGLVRAEAAQIVGGAAAYFPLGGQVVAPQLGMVVGKSGRTTQITQGRVTAVGVSATVGYDGRAAFFAGQFTVEGTDTLFSRGGDSGSCVWTWDSARNPAGLLFAGGRRHSICSPMSTVLSALDITIFT
ncbi:chymotrypsin family serine protease [Nonomuraea turcica]|uniref:hypothetical protein n=1 Tax=Nonomuraea sp. G32 TaxID=3067274 RepID=UPI00273BA1DA|nr:hypothetical protein [Nonomuraea sp. G32]MDP4511732.1 hypothetical protein [Nonomuraea sp. G32]